jgi:hypothetical protein
MFGGEDCGWWDTVKAVGSSYFEQAQGVHNVGQESWRDCGFVWVRR